MWNFQGSWVLALKFPRDVTWNFHGYWEKPKQFQGLFKKTVCPQPLPPPTCLVFSSGIAHSKAIDLNWSYGGICPERSIDHMPRLGICIIFMCSIIIISFRKVHTSVLWYQLIGVGSTPPWKVKPPFFSCIPNICICCKYIIEGRGKSPPLQHFIKCF